MLQLKIVTPEGLFISEEVEMVIGRGIEGDLAILKNRSPITTPLQIGPLRVFKDGNERLASVVSGYLSALDNEVTVVTDAAEWSDEIDLERAQKAKERAERRLANRPDGLDVARAELALKRAINRINCANRR